MKKYCITLISIALLSVLTACGNTSAATTDENSATSEEKTDVAVADGSLAALYSEDYASLGDYKGLEVLYEVAEPTEEEIQATIERDLNSLSEEVEVSNRPVQVGDIANIDYRGTKDGVAFNGGTAEGYDLEIGSGNFIAGFEEGLIGANVGDNVDLNLTFPESYPAEDLAGQDVVFNVTINSIKERKIPELTAEVVSNLGDGYASVEEYKDAIYQELYNENKTKADSEVRNELIRSAVSNASIKDAPEWLVELSTASVRNTAASYAQMYGVDLDTFISMALNETKEEFEAECATYGKENAEQTLVAYAIAAKEGLTLDESKVKENIEEYKAAYGLSDEELEQTGQAKYLESYLQLNEVIDYLYDNAVFVDANGNKVTP